MKLDKKTKETLLLFQQSEITEHFVYKEFADSVKNKKNRELLLKISSDELNHYNIWKKYTKKDVPPIKWKILLYKVIVKIFGISFTAKLMEKNENSAERKYRNFIGKFKETELILKDENNHENSILSLIDEKRVKYISSMVLGLNDALVELSGTLAGLSFALRNNKLIGLVGIITGIAAAMSMSSAEYLAQRSESEEGKNPIVAAFFTGVAYILTVIVLVAPYLILKNYISALIWSISNGILALLLFSFFISVVKEKSFAKTSTEMFAINAIVIIISLIIGTLVRNFIGIDI